MEFPEDDRGLDGGKAVRELPDSARPALTSASLSHSLAHFIEAAVPCAWHAAPDGRGVCR